MQGITFSRRSLARGAICSVPAIAASSTVPALASSPMPVTMLWSGFGAPDSRLANRATQRVDGVNGDFTGPEYSVTLTWEEPISSLPIDYRQGVYAAVVSSPVITISPVTFTPTVTG